MRKTAKQRARLMRPSLRPVGYSLPSSRVCVGWRDFPPAWDADVGALARSPCFSISASATSAGAVIDSTSACPGPPGVAMERPETVSVSIALLSFSKLDLLGAMVGACDSGTAAMESRLGSSMVGLAPPESGEICCLKSGKRIGTKESRVNNVGLGVRCREAGLKKRDRERKEGQDMAKPFLQVRLNKKKSRKLLPLFASLALIRMTPCPLRLVGSWRPSC